MAFSDASQSARFGPFLTAQIAGGFTALRCLALYKTQLSPLTPKLDAGKGQPEFGVLPEWRVSGRPNLALKANCVHTYKDTMMKQDKTHPGSACRSKKTLSHNAGSVHWN